eukprot:Rhum_TRINITY_DN13867_c0_g1::Rhum_TRINITY_DN13867_c0_g1_i1::g.65116::m.65116
MVSAGSSGEGSATLRSESAAPAKTTSVGFVRLRSGECLGKVLDALGSVSTRLYVAIPASAPADAGCQLQLQSQLSTIYGAAFLAHVDTVVLFQDHRPADISTLHGYADEAAEAKSAGWHFHELSRPDSPEWGPGGPGPPEWPPERSPGPPEWGPDPPEPFSASGTPHEADRGHPFMAPVHGVPFGVVCREEMYTTTRKAETGGDLDAAEDGSCPDVLRCEEYFREERERLRQRERARCRRSVVDGRNWWDPFQSTEPVLPRDGVVVPDRTELMRHHPLTSLELVDVPHEFRSKLPAFCEWGQGAVLHMFEHIRKRDRKFLTEKRVLLVTDSNLYRCKTTGVIDRCTSITDILELFVDGPGGRSVGIKMEPQHEHDMLYDFTSPLRARQFVEIITTIHGSVGRGLRVTTVSAISDAQLDFSRSSNYSFKLREVLLKEGLYKMCRRMKELYYPDPSEQASPAPLCVDAQSEKVQHHPFNGLPFVDVPFAFRRDFSMFDGAALHMFEQVSCESGSQERVLLVTDSDLYRCTTLGSVERCTSVCQVAELIVDGRSVGIRVQAPDYDNHGEDDMLYDFATPAQADTFTEVVQTIQDKLRSSMLPGSYNSQAVLDAVAMCPRGSVLGAPKVLRAQVVHEPNPGAKLNFNRRSQHEKDMARPHVVPMAKEHLLQGQVHVQAPPYVRQPFTATVPELPEEIRRHPISGLPLVDVPKALCHNFSSLCRQRDSVVMHMCEEIQLRDHNKGSEPRLLVVFETSFQLWLPSGSPERWASVDEIAELIVDGCSVGVKMQALDNSEHDMLYDFATPARADTFTEIVQTIQDKLRSSKTLWARVVRQPNPGARLNFDRPKNYRYQTRGLPRKGRLHETWRVIESVDRYRHEEEQDRLEEEYDRRAATPTQTTPRYRHVCTGGTFDHLHNWHKVQLSHAASYVEPGGRLYCDVTGDALLAESPGRRMVQPYGRRARVVRQFLSSIRPDVSCEVSELTAGYGPSVNKPAMQAVVPRSWYGLDARRCRDERAKQGAPAIDVLFPATCCPQIFGRAPGFGRLLTEQLMCKRNASKTYVIGVTGGIASGKSTACQYLELAAEHVQVVYSDELDERAYAAGTDAGERICKLFPPAAREDGSVDRKALGGCVLGAGNEGNLKKLTAIVWPVVADEMRGKIAGCRKRVLVVEAGVCEEGGLESFCDEVWEVVVPPSTAKARLMQRDSLTAEEAEAQVASQLPDAGTAAHLLLPNDELPGDGDAEVETLLQHMVHHALEELLCRVDVTFESLQGDSGGLPCRFAGLLTASAHPKTRAAHWWRELRDRYTRCERDFHNLSHLDEMFGLLDTHRSKLVRPDLVAYAVFFHDAVYDAAAKNALNEERSADLWRVFAAENRAAGGRVTAEDEALVASWIVRTASHAKGEASGDLAYFLDMGLAVLGREAPRYAEYAEQVSLEQSHVAYGDFARLRTQALAGFLDKPEGPYHTADFQAAFGRRALANVRAEISRLRDVAANV